MPQRDPFFAGSGGPPAPGYFLDTTARTSPEARRARLASGQVLDVLPLSLSELLRQDSEQLGLQFDG